MEGTIQPCQVRWRCSHNKTSAFPPQVGQVRNMNGVNIASGAHDGESGAKVVVVGCM